jgi:hypothetical protein
MKNRYYICIECGTVVVLDTNEENYSPVRGEFFRCGCTQCDTIASRRTKPLVLITDKNQREWLEILYG